MLIDRLEEFFETKGLKNYQRNRINLFWILSIFIGSAGLVGYFANRFMLNAGSGDSLNPVVVFVSLVTASIFAYLYRHVRICVLVLTGVAIVSSVCSLIWKSGIFLHI